MSIMITYRFAKVDDAVAIAELHTSSWRKTYRGILQDEYLDGNIGEERFAIWQNRLTDPVTNQRIMLAEENGQLRGFICLFLDENPLLGTLIDNLHVVPASKGLGIGAGLMQESVHKVIPEATLPGFHLAVYELNLAAIRFYDRMGGQCVGREEHHPPGGGVAISLRYAWKTVADLRGRT